MKNRLLTRREFLDRCAGYGAVGLTAPAIVSSGLCSGANDRIGIGMIGMGRQAVYANLNPFLTSPDTQVLAVCDVDAWRLNEAKKKVEEYYDKNDQSGNFKECSAYKDFRELLARKDIDAVMISTPDHWHVPIACAAVRRGKDVCCEKPLTLSVAEGRFLSDLVTKHKRVFRTDSEFRSLKVFHRQCELVVNGRIGVIDKIVTGVPLGDIGCPPQPEMPVPEELDYEMWLGPAPQAPYSLNRVHPRHAYTRPGWMRVRDYCEGMVTNWGAHLNDIAQWGAGTDRTGPVKVEGRGEYPKEGLWNVLLNFEIQYEYANGMRLTYKTERPYVRFEGSEGWIEADYSSRKLTAHPESILQSEIKDDEIHLRFKSDKGDFIDAVKTRGQTLEDAEVGHRTTSLCQIGHIAIQIGKSLDWDPQNERFKNNDAANKLLTRPMHAPWNLTDI